MPHDAFYSSAAWRRFRAEVLRERPRCEVPGCPEPPKHVDHKVSRAKGGEALSKRNVQVLCHHHHSSKTVTVDGGFGRPSGTAQLRVRGCTADGMPIDPRHPWNRPR
jgi:5-methylcytosine-specific restriction endonuclease McrA